MERYRASGAGGRGGGVGLTVSYFVSRLHRANHPCSLGKGQRARNKTVKKRGALSL